MSKIVFIGGGNMARALISGLSSAVSDNSFHVIDKSDEILIALREDFGCTVSSEMDETVKNADVIVIAVKPHIVNEVCGVLHPFLSDQVVISIASAVPHEKISQWLHGYTTLVRAMPNTPALVRAGMTGLFAPAGVDDSARNLASNVFRSVGEVIWCGSESMIDSVTAISGSGPAYVFYLVESMMEAGRRLGFDNNQARMLAEATAVGAMELLRQSGESATLLRTRVTSKGGTTAAAISTLEHLSVMEAVVRAAFAARDWAVEMRDQYEQVPTQ
ncbi:pyrroline-5-carboxylate reductase [Pandoraea cepalis]|uniref:Pyrroline-5-carboxylate reductase n=1 Tax=Pandoraea cepalis TaxID=2508294 RepID=A0A5E4TAM5_9BURK|nr:pyrroline-5-carboxylate reductase [Pandoraea cepalis]VVD84312.1 pyrroline-5-carboxylate reductase [Pandoraea cepalis]